MAAACPAVLIPLPNAIDDHQRKNAAFLANAGAAIVLEQADTSANDLAELCITFTQVPERLNGMMKAARSMAKLDATQRIVRACEEAIDDR
jgi:UDP-N-acetylglucosamine--N-acetylmuramyl-(pentapeptide) pyrophosphoryl-undecaprenol N-acetylglucosamine transferase